MLPSVFLSLGSYALVMLVISSAVSGLSASRFRSLNSGSTGNSKDAAAEDQQQMRIDGSNNICCARQQKKHFVGYGLDGEQLYVDVGQCRQSCSSSKKNKIHRKEFEAFLKANQTVDPVELFLSLQRDDSTKSCGGEESGSGMTRCLPTRTVMERHMTMSGLEQVAVIEDCTCTVHQHQHCHRVEDPVVYFVGTPFETIVDVGRCSGSCSNNSPESSCTSIKNKTVSIAGPNGDTLIEITEKCSCAPSCYRASYMEHVYDYSLSLEDDDGDEETTEPTIKVIDVGKCMGECSSSQPKQHCVLRDTEDSTKCLMSLTRRENNCVPLGFQMHRYRTKKGVEKNLLSITDCGCQ